MSLSCERPPKPYSHAPAPPSRGFPWLSSPCVGSQNDPNAKLIPEVHDLTSLTVDTGTTAGSEFGTGGMVTKLVAARIATSSGCRWVGSAVFPRRAWSSAPV